MCMIDDGDPCDVWSRSTPHARKPYRCDECRAPITAGEQYVRINMLYDHAWSTARACRACEEGPCAWLTEQCGGYCCHGVQEDLEEHWSEGLFAWGVDKDPVERLRLGRLVVEMRRRGMRAFA